MITWYLLVILANGQPQPQVFPNEQQACVAYLANPGSHVYALTGKRDDPSVSEGDCKPVQQFIHK